MAHPYKDKAKTDKQRADNRYKDGGTVSAVKPVQIGTGMTAGAATGVGRLQKAKEAKKND